MPGQRGSSARVPVSTGRRTSRHVHSWVHSWGQTHTGVVTRVAALSHASHTGHFRRSAQCGPGPSLHTRWTTLGAERHVDLWTKRPSVHSVPAHDHHTTRAPVPRGTRA